MLLGLRTVIYPVHDLPAATAWFTQVVGHPPYFEEPFFVGFNVAGYELGLLPVEGDAPTAPLTYWGVPDAGAAVAELVAAGATVGDPLADVGDGIRIGTVIAPMGSVVGIIENPEFSLPGASTLPAHAGPGR